MNPERVRNPESGIRNPESGIRSPEPGTRQINEWFKLRNIIDINTPPPFSAFLVKWMIIYGALLRKGTSTQGIVLIYNHVEANKTIHIFTSFLLTSRYCFSIRNAFCVKIVFWHYLTRNINLKKNKWTDQKSKRQHLNARKSFRFFVQNAQIANDLYITLVYFHWRKTNSSVVIYITMWNSKT